MFPHNDHLSNEPDWSCYSPDWSSNAEEVEIYWDCDGSGKIASSPQQCSFEFNDSNPQSSPELSDLQLSTPSKLRCKLCQFNNRPCEYISLGSPCSSCKFYSAPCGPKLPPRPIPSSSSSFSRTPVFTDAVVDPLDSHYFFFFLSSMPHLLPYTNLFPNVVADIFARATEQDCVRYSVLSIASGVVDYRLQRSMDRFQRQYILSLQSIQNAIQTLQIDEGLAVAVFLISWIDVVRGKFDTTRKHLRGLRLILEHLEPNWANPAMGKSNLSPLVMQIWRVAIKFDWAASLFLLAEPIFPTIPAAEDAHRRWVRTMTGAGDATEWALAAFALDNLIHKACHFAIQVRTLRSNSSRQIEATVLSLVGLLEGELASWRRRPIIRTAEWAEENVIRRDSLISTRMFLEYPVYHVSNSFFANLLNAWRAISIYISLILDPTIGPSCQFRFDIAVDICRVLATLADDKSNSASSKIWILFLAGVAFGGPDRSPREAKWIVDKAMEIMQVIPVFTAALAAHEILWRSDGDFWEELERTRSQIYNP